MKKPTPQPTKQQIQQFIDALKNNESHFLDMGEYTIKLHNWMQIGLFIKKSNGLFITILYQNNGS